MMRKKSAPVLELSRDMYGFVVKPQHFQRYTEFASIYKVEEAERSERWDEFLKTFNASASDGGAGEADFQSHVSLDSEQDNAVSKPRTVQRWSELRSSLNIIARGLNHRVKKPGDKKQNENGSMDNLSVEEQQDTKQAQGGSEDESEEEFYDLDKSDAPTVGITSSDTELCSEDCPWKEELQFLVRGGVPMALRGELWQVFVATKARRTEGHYDVLLTPANNASTNGFSSYVEDYVPAVEKWASQIEKDLPRTFPGHPALDEDGRNALRRLLTAYARHNPDVGYCQAMNFFAALLLLLMPEENAFWTLTGIMDDYFEGYYSEKLLEAQVDQLVLEELSRQHFPKLLSHLDKLGVQLSWITGPWFLSIFVNVLPWESVLRVWDVLLFEGSRSMLFRTTLALLELHAPALLVAQDAGDLTTLMKTVAGATFDSSQLVLTACMGFQNVTESVLELLRSKHRPTVLATLHERAAELLLWKSSKAALAKKLSRKYTAKGISTASETANGDVSTIEEATAVDEEEEEELDEIAESELQDLQEQIVWLKNELCLALEDKKRAVIRAEELDLALMEIVKEDNRRELSAKVEKLESEVAMLQRMLIEKQEEEKAMVQVMMRIEQEQKLTEDARRFAEKDAEAQRHAARVMQEEYEEALKKLSAMENRAVIAETMLEATLQYEAGQPGSNARRLEPSRWSWSSLASPRNPCEVAPLPKSKSGSPAELKSAADGQERKQGLFSLMNWRERNKAKQEETNVTKENAVSGEGHNGQSHQAFAEENGDNAAEARKPGDQFDQTV